MSVPRSGAGSAGTPSLVSVPLLSQNKKQLFLTFCCFLNSLLPCEARPGIKTFFYPLVLITPCCTQGTETWTALGIRIPVTATDVSSFNTAQQAGQEEAACPSDQKIPLPGVLPHTRAGPSFSCPVALCPATRSHLSHCWLPCSAWKTLGPNPLKQKSCWHPRELKL